MTGLQIKSIFLAFFIAIFVFSIALMLITALTENKRTVIDRIAKIRGKEQSIFDNVTERKKRRNDSVEDKLRKTSMSGKKRIIDNIFNELLLAGIAMRPEEFGVVWLLLVFAPSGLTALFTGRLLPSVVLAIAGAVLPIIFVKSKRKKRTQLFESQLGDSLLVMSNCLRSGLSFQQAIETIAKDMSPPVSVEFARVINEIKYGNSLEAALNNMVDRIKSADLLITVSAVNIQRQTGGNLSEVLMTIAETIKERNKIKQEIRTITAQGRMSGLIIGALPIVVGAMLMVIAPDYFGMMIEETLGKAMLAGAAVMEVFGFFIIKKIITIEY